MTPRMEGVVVELVMPGTTCAPCQDALEELDHAAALVGPEMRARGERLRVRVTEHSDPGACEEDGSTPILVEVRVNDVPVPSHAWNGSTYPVPPAELITAAIQDEIDRMGPRPGQGSPRPSVSGSRR